MPTTKTEIFYHMREKFIFYYEFPENLLRVRNCWTLCWKTPQCISHIVFVFSFQFNWKPNELFLCKKTLYYYITCFYVFWSQVSSTFYNSCIKTKFFIRYFQFVFWLRPVIFNLKFFQKNILLVIPKEVLRNVLKHKYHNWVKHYFIDSAVFRREFGTNFWL